MVAAQTASVRFVILAQISIRRLVGLLSHKAYCRANR
jgi:hypothetical protein